MNATRRLPITRPTLLNINVAVASGAVSFVLAVLLLWLAWPEFALGAGKDERAHRSLRLSEVARGSLLFPADEAGLFDPAPILRTDVRMRVSGMIARVHVKQRFRNTSTTWQEGIYVFPLPDEAAVDQLRLEIGGRVIEGQIQEREAAKKAYEKARDEGRQAGLVEQERPNIFTTSVANIAPGEVITVEIGYQQTLRYDAGAYHLRFPMVVGPRFIPGETRVAGLQGTGWGPNTNQVTDAARITPPVRLPFQGLANPVSFDIELDAGFPIARVFSSYLGIDHAPGDQQRLHIDVEGDSLPADRDFDLVWTPLAGAAPKTALFGETLDEDAYLLVMVLPALPDREAAPPPRETVFVIDTSGSMHGTSLDQAKAALGLALDTLRPVDRFNIIQFNTWTSSLFRGPRPADRENLARARRYVDGLEADGGTIMMPALSAALDGRGHSGLLRQVVFLTDGSVGNEDALFERIAQRLGDSRLFTVGIGSAPNGYFMTRAAKFGRGTYTYISDASEVAERMGVLLRKLARPALTDLRVAWPEDLDVEMWPARLPDLYEGEPVIFTARLKRAALEGVGDASITGLVGGRTWQASLPLGPAAGGLAVDDEGVAAVWARSKIAALTEAVNGADAEAVRAAVVEVALHHRLVSRYTSLVAVDVTPVRSQDEGFTSGTVPVNLPRGWSYAKVFGTLPATATPAPMHLATGLGALLLAAALWWYRRRRFAP